ncbi:MAG TPA: hypothetical protein VHN14_27770 [Kofleriaceae bacterium]|jgi:hypothetical protein|nr:hypothetical protein [Kofleriaceae bacterium]
MRTVLLAVVLTSVVLPVSVFADPGPRTDVTKMVTDDCARARKAGKACVLDVPPEDVGGQTPSAGDTGTRVLVFRSETSLIRLRRDFLPEIRKACEDL